jgi:hypothetical protein
MSHKTHCVCSSYTRRAEREEIISAYVNIPLIKINEREKNASAALPGPRTDTGLLKLLFLLRK